jgi:hypothetical protein
MDFKINDHINLNILMTLKFIGFKLVIFEKQIQNLKS